MKSLARIHILYVDHVLLSNAIQKVPGAQESVLLCLKRQNEC